MVSWRRGGGGGSSSEGVGGGERRRKWRSPLNGDERLVQDSAVARFHGFMGYLLFLLFLVGEDAVSLTVRL
jgi:hypothetical protein